jgi:hypothetical protein
MKIVKTVPGIALASLIAAAAPAHAQLFKCVNPQGRTIYQDQPCEEKAKQSTIRGAPAAPAPAPPAEEAAKEAPKEDPNAPDKPISDLTRAAIEVVVGYAMCSERVPGFSETYTPPYEAWKRRNEAEMKKMSYRAEARLLSERLRVERTRTESFEDRCGAFGAELVASGKQPAPRQ